MEVAAEMDISANEEGKPAVNKVKMLPAVEEKLSQTMLHRELLDGGILGALKLWIRAPARRLSCPTSRCAALEAARAACCCCLKEATL